MNYAIKIWQWFISHHNELFVGAILIVLGEILHRAVDIFNNNKNIIITQHIKHKDIYINNAITGSFKFDYSNNNGEFTIGNKDHIFHTKWSKASDTNIHAYSGGIDIDSICLLKGPVDIKNIDKINGDYSSRVRTPAIGDAIVWKNRNGRLAITKIISIKDDSRGAAHDELECEYVIVD